MSTSTLYRLGALAGFLSGVCIIIGRLLARLPDSQLAEIFDLLSPFFALFFAVALYLVQRRESGVYGGIAFIVLFTGLVTLVCLDYYGAFIRIHLPVAMRAKVMEGPGAHVFVGSLLTFLVGEILFGISVIRAQVNSTIAAILFMAGLIPVALHPSGIFPESVVDMGAAAAGIAFFCWSTGLNRLAGTKIEPA